MAVLVSLSEADLQTYSAGASVPPGFDLFFLGDDQAADASGGDFTYEIVLNAIRNPQPDYWSIVSLVCGAPVGTSLGNNFVLENSATEPWERFQRWANNAPIWAGTRTALGSGATGLVEAHPPMPIYLGRPLLNRASPSQGGLILRTANTNGARFTFNVILARNRKPIPWPSLAVM